MIAYIKRLAYLVLTMTNCFCIVLPIYVYEEIYHKKSWYGTVNLYTKADSETWNSSLKNIKNAREVKDLISKLVEDARDKKKVVGKEFFDENLNFEDHLNKNIVLSLV